MFDPLKVKASSGLSQKQRLFAWAIGKLNSFVYKRGWAFACEDFNRPDGQGHMPDSLHYEKLAGDQSLFIQKKDWEPGHRPPADQLSTDGWIYVRNFDDCPEVWTQIGSFWEGLHPLCTWGGGFGDYNHFSITRGGRK